MIAKSLRILLTAILVALPLLFVSYAISYFVNDSGKSLDLILFVVGAIPIVSFGAGIFTRSTSGALHTPKVIWRTVGFSNQNDDGSHSGVLYIPQVIYHLVGSPNRDKNEAQNAVGNKPHAAAHLSLVLSGVILWAVSFFV
ncbi:MAG: hypothetical protein MJE63_03115 [Proteobacteria bacterium]|nr:hypothetical protein [Pseudomonadota bacterium]